MKQTQKQGRKLLGVLLTLALVFGLLPGMTLTALADKDTVSVPYLEATVNETTHAVTFANAFCTTYTYVTSSDTAWSEGWYVVNSDVTIGSQITVTGNVNLILCDGAKLTVNGGIKYSDNKNLTIYAQSAGTGELVANGGSNDGIKANNVTINGGKVTASATNTSAICSNIDLTINGGTVTANGTSNGLYAGNGNVTINGGTVTASGNDSGIHNGNQGAVTINGGKVTASGVTKALDGTVKNAIAGTGWTDKEGTKGEASIEVNTEGWTLDTYKKVQFLAPHTHDGITFQPWTSTTSLPSTEGNYYLTDDVTLTETWTWTTGTVKLCLNGYGIRMDAEKRVIFIGGNTLELYDCNSDNKVHYVTLEEWRGKSVSDSDTESAVTNGSGVVKVNGGYITGGYAKETGYTEGGCIYIGASGTFTMHGGTILGNKAAGLGGGIWSGGKLNIGGNSRVNYNSGSGQNSGVYLAEKAKAFNISGTPDFTGNRVRDIVFNNNTYNAGTKINFTPFNPDVRLGRVYIQTNLTGVITSNAYFTNDDVLKAVMQPIDVNSVFGVNADHQAQIVHVHSFTYAAGEGENANRITVTCSKDYCVLPDSKVELTINAPTLKTSGGSGNAAATLTDELNLHGTAQIQYQKKKGEDTWDEASTTAPSEPGTYKASITLKNVKTSETTTGNVTAYVEYTISPAPIYIDVSPATYKVSLPAETEGGKLTASRAAAPKGATVTITAAPDEGYQAVKPTVTDKDGKSVELKDNGNDTWSFLMPGSDVTVKGSFEKTEPAKPEGKEKFVDVPADAWYHDDVYWAVEKGITLGVDDTHFAPDADCTRGQFVTFLWRAAGQPVSNSAANPFVDVKAGDYYYDAVLWAVEKGITKGTDDTHFDPVKPVTRAQAITFLYRYEQSEGRGFTGLWAFRLDYSDAEQVPDWAYEAFCWMVKENICKGSDGKLEPDALCPRCQVVALLARIFNA